MAGLEPVLFEELNLDLPALFFTSLPTIRGNTVVIFYIDGSDRKE